MAGSIFARKDCLGLMDMRVGRQHRDLPVLGSWMTEFFRQVGRTLVLTDLIEIFEAGKLGRGVQLLSGLGGVLDPDVGTRAICA